MTWASTFPSKPLTYLADSKWHFRAIPGYRNARTKGFPKRSGVDWPLGLFVAAHNANRSDDLARFAGTWEAKYQGTTFFTVHLTLANGNLGGTCVVGEGWAITDDGEFIPDGCELSTHKILEATASGKKLLLKISENKIGEENSSEMVPVELTLTGGDQAEGRVVAGSNSDTPPPQKKLWHFQRISQ